MAPTNRNPPTSNRQLLIILGIFLSIILGIIWLVGLIVDNLVWIIPPKDLQQLIKQKNYEIKNLSPLPKELG